MSPLVLAHAGHWVEGIAFGGPVVVVPAVLAVLVVRERRRERLADAALRRPGPPG